MKVRSNFAVGKSLRAGSGVLTVCVVTGITEIQIIQWYVQEGARIEEWSPLCQYQSDKAVDDVRDPVSSSRQDNG